MTDLNTALSLLEAAVTQKKLTPNAAANIRVWLTEPYLAEFAPEVIGHLEGGKWKELEEAFWTTIPFGTGGRRGRLYPIGCNAINDRTIGESAQGLADYVKSQVPGKAFSCAIAYDTRHRSREFAELCAEIMVANGYKVFFLNGYRSTPELSFAVRYHKCDCGIMITASHNPPTDNAVKVYWSTGGQLLPPHDEDSIARMQSVTAIKRADFSEAIAQGNVTYCEKETDKAFVKAVLRQSHVGSRDLKIIYSPLHGVGASAVLPVLEAAGFEDVELFALHADPSPDFPNVPKHVANPENAAVFDAIIQRAQQTGAELILATDPDCDRLGIATPKTRQPGAPWVTLTGNQLGSLLTDYLLASLKAEGRLTPEHYVVKTLVTTELIRRIADAYGVQTAGDLLVGFKYIGGEMDIRGPEKFVFGAEESYGFLIGDHARDKDAAVASLVTAELAAQLKAEGRTLYEQLEELFHRHGVFTERQVNLQMPGETGMDAMRALMAAFRTSPPQSLGGLKVVRVRDYLSQTQTQPGGKPEPLAGPKGDMVILDLDAEGNYVAVRPSGTEPKVKFYTFAYDPPQADADLDALRAAQVARLEAVERDLKAIAGV